MPINIYMRDILIIGGEIEVGDGKLDLPEYEV
jgi:hypothetical protein